MKITDVRIRKVAKDGKMKAVVSITLDGEFVVHDIKVIEGPERLFVAMPSRKEANGVFRDIVHPISPAARKQFEDAILSAYRQELLLHQAREPEPAPGLTAAVPAEKFF